MLKLNPQIETKVIRYAIVVFWILFWLFNVIDKFISKATFLWVGKDRLTQFVNYFHSIGIENQSIALVFLVIVTLAEIVALIFVLYAFINLVYNKEVQARTYFFWGTVTGLVIFTFFTVGDQVFGDRVELLEHTTYWAFLIISWAAYNYLGKTKS